MTSHTLPCGCCISWNDLDCTGRPHASVLIDPDCTVHHVDSPPQFRVDDTDDEETRR